MMLAPAEVNQKNRAFWSTLQPRLDALIADSAVFETAFSALQAELRAGVPVYHQKTPAEALLEAEAAQQRFREQLERKVFETKSQVEKQARSELGRKGGRAKRPDHLQELIVDLVREHPKLSLRSLHQHLKDAERGGIIEEITDGAIHFISRDGHSKSVCLRAVTHRLTRARKFLGSLQSR